MNFWEFVDRNGMGFFILTVLFLILSAVICGEGIIPLVAQTLAG
jgi:hypothetical protein